MIGLQHFIVLIIQVQGLLLSDEEQAFMLKDYAHQIIILIIALRQGRYFTT